MRENDLLLLTALPRCTSRGVLQRGPNHGILDDILGCRRMAAQVPFNSPLGSKKTMNKWKAQSWQFVIHTTMVRITYALPSFHTYLSFSVQ